MSNTKASIRHKDQITTSPSKDITTPYISPGVVANSIAFFIIKHRDTQDRLSPIIKQIK